MVGWMEELLLGSEQVGRVVQTVQRVEEVHLQGIKNREEERMTSLAVWLNHISNCSYHWNIHSGVVSYT